MQSEVVMVGNPTKRSDLASTDVTTFVYDETYRLVNERASGSLAYNITHTYDPVGNRLFEDSGTQRATFTYDVANQLATAVFPTTVRPNHQYTYDGAGNLAIDFDTPSFARYYTWNAENQLIHAESDRQNIYDYEYDGDGLRTAWIEGSNYRRFLWDFQNMLRESPGTAVIYTYNPQLYGDLLGRRTGSTIRWYVYDAQGSATKQIDGSGTVINSSRFSAYGKLLSMPGHLNFRWIGRHGYFYDDEDYPHYYVRARYYSPATATWMSQDPIGFEGRSWNLYQYVASNPSNFIDPSGLANFWNPITWGINSPNQTWGGFFNPFSDTNPGIVGPAAAAAQGADAGNSSICYYLFRPVAWTTGDDWGTTDYYNQAWHDAGLEGSWSQTGSNISGGISAGVAYGAGVVAGGEFLFLGNQPLLVEGVLGGGTMGSGGIVQIRPTGGAAWCRLDCHRFPIVGGLPGQGDIFYGPPLPHVDTPFWPHFPWGLPPRF